MKIPPFEELQDGLPVWRVQVSDPAAAASQPIDFSWRELRLSKGSILCLAFSLHDGPGKPLLFHHALLGSSRGLANLRQAKGLLLIFERHGFISDGQKHVELGSEPPLLEAADPAVLTDYVEGWRRELPRLGSPAKIWDALEAQALQPVPAARRSPWPLLAAAALLALAATLAWYFFK